MRPRRDGITAALADVVSVSADCESLFMTVSLHWRSLQQLTKALLSQLLADREAICRVLSQHASQIQLIEADHGEQRSIVAEVDSHLGTQAALMNNCYQQIAKRFRATSVCSSRLLSRLARLLSTEPPQFLDSIDEHMDSLFLDGLARDRQV
jgi:hypothetical protein